MERCSLSMWRMEKQGYPLKDNPSLQMNMGSSSPCPATGLILVKEAGKHFKIEDSDPRHQH